MAYIKIYPKTPGAERRLEEMEDALPDLLKACVLSIWPVPREDIIVETHRCTVLTPDREARDGGYYPSVIVEVWTSDPFQELAGALRDAILATWKEHCLGLKLEVWIGFFHTWGTNS